MSDISKRFEQFIRSNQLKLAESGVFLPIKVGDSILVGQAKITAQGLYKNIWYKDDLIYPNVNLNAVTIKLANGLASRSDFQKMDELYRADQEYDKFFIESTMFYHQYQINLKKSDAFKIDLFWTRYLESKLKCKIAKEKAQRLAMF